jgi:tRNA A-37 threonylcarbamoyl transferase component Bud32
VIGQRYKLIDEIGTGGMGAVYRAHDRLSGQYVALKQVQTHEHLHSVADDGSDVTRLNLAQEFRLLAALHHPHIIQVLDYGFDSRRRPFYTMELLENAQTILEAGEGQAFNFKINLLIELLQALAYLHHRDVTHCDLKPSNVLVANNHVKVLDFGLSMLGDLPTDGGGTTAGTLAYMSPEVLAGAPITVAADLYAVGVIAFELLVGRHPFHRDDLGRLIHQVLYAPPDLTDVDLTPELQLFLGRLLAKDPNERYDSAHDALLALADAADYPLPSETIEIRESFLQTAPLIGRDSELRLLMDALFATTKEHGSAWLVSGESGVGKSRLLEELRIRAMVHGRIVVRGRGDNQRASPYALWRPLFRWLCLLTRVEQEEASILSMVMPDLADLVDEALPLDECPSQRQLQQVIQRLLTRIEQPMVLILEDLHWVGSESLSLLNFITQLTMSIPLLIVGSFRDDEAPALPAALPQMTILKLQRLTEDNIAHLTQAILGDAGRKSDVVDFLHRETEGNVFFLLEIMRILAQEAGQLDQIGNITLPNQVYAGGVQQIVQKRLARLGTGARPLLTLAAVAGRQIDLQILRTLAPDVDLEVWLTECSNAAVLEFQDGGWKFTHDKIREGVTAELSDESLYDLHKQVAAATEYLYASQPEYAPALAYQWKMAHNAVKEYEFTARAGELSLRSGAYQEAITYFTRARELAEVVLESDILTLAYLNSRLAEAHLGLGHYEVAKQLYDDSLTSFEGKDHAPETADIYSKLGDIEYALEAFETAEVYYQQSLTLYRSLDHQKGIVKTLNNLGNVAYDREDYTRATQLYQESLTISRAIGARWGMAGSSASDEDTVEL